MDRTRSTPFCPEGTPFALFIKIAPTFDLSPFPPLVRQFISANQASGYVSERGEKGQMVVTV